MKVRSVLYKRIQTYNQKTCITCSHHYLIWRGLCKISIEIGKYQIIQAMLVNFDLSHHGKLERFCITASGQEHTD